MCEWISMSWEVQEYNLQSPLCLGYYNNDFNVSDMFIRWLITNYGKGMRGETQEMLATQIMVITNV
jgi:hypothetical protein